MSVGDPYAQMEEDYIKIADGEDAEFMEFPKEENNTVMLSTIQAQFPNAIGIKYKGSSGAWRAIRAVDNVLDAPKGGWGDRVYCITLAETTKRKSDYEYVARDSKVMRTETVDPLLKDMAVIGLPFKLTDEELKEYFEKNYGELTYSEVKKERETGRSRGFGFIRFKDAESAKAALVGDHYMMGRKVEVRQKKIKPMKLFVGRLSSGTTQEDLNKYFGQYGELTDTYIPTPFRNFAFITMASTENAKTLLRDSHVLNGAHLNVMERNPDNRDRERNSDNRDGGDRNQGNRGDRDRRGDDRAQSNYTSSTSNYNSNNYSGSNSASNVMDRPSQVNMANDIKNMLFTLLTGGQS